MPAPKGSSLVPSKFATRLAEAIAAAGKTPTRTGREAGLQAGYIFKLLGIARAKPVLSPGPEVVQMLADYLGVEYEWLAIGRGPMRHADWESSPLEEARRFALRHGMSEDTIAATIARVRTDEGMSALEWIAMFVIVGGRARPSERRARDADAPRERARVRRGSAA